MGKGKLPFTHSPFPGFTFSRSPILNVIACLDGLAYIARF